MAQSPEAHDLLELMPFAARLGISIRTARPAEVRGRLAWSSELCTADGVLHGGVLMALADTVGAGCAYLNLGAGMRTATIGSSTVFHACRYPAAPATDPFVDAAPHAAAPSRRPGHR